MELTQEKLKEVLYYNPCTGIFTWVISPRRGISVGTIAGALSPRGYVLIGISSKIYRAHRLAHLYMTGHWPSEGVDHENHVKSDNRWLNIREAPQIVNGKNLSKSKRNKSGVTGVFWHRGHNRWLARIVVDGEHKHLGSFTTLLAAAYCRHAANLKHNFHPNHGATNEN